MAQLSASVEVENGDLITLTWIDPLTDAQYSQYLSRRATEELERAAEKSLRGYPVGQVAFP